MRLILSLLALVLACAPIPSAPIDPEIPLGSPIRSGVIVEVTLDHQVCGSSRCRRVVSVLHQGGGASREFTTGAVHDSTRVSSIDSVAFARLAVRLWGGGFFSPERPRVVAHPPLAQESWLLTIASRSGRTTRQFTLFSGMVPGDVQVVQWQIDELRWTVPK